MARKTTITCDTCDKELNPYRGVVYVRYLKRPTDIYQGYTFDNHFDFCSVECMAEYESNVGFEKEVQ
jgi:hypothetical protein